MGLSSTALAKAGRSKVLAVEAGALDYRSPLPDNRTYAIGSLKMECGSHFYPAQWIGSAVPVPYAKICIQ